MQYSDSYFYFYFLNKHTSQTPTCTEGSKNFGSKIPQLAELFYTEQILVHWLAGDAFQLGGVRQSDTDCIDMDAFCSGLFRFRNGSAGVDVGHTVSDHDGHIGNLRTVTIRFRVHLSSHGVEGVGRVGAAVAVGDIIDGCEESQFVLVFVQVELQVVLRAVDDDTHTHVAVVNVGVEEEVLDEVLHDEEVEFRDAGGGIHHKHHVHQGVIALWREWEKC